MIVRLSGKLIEKKDQSLVIDNSGLCYEIIVPTSVLNRIEQTMDDKGHVHLVIYYYFQLGPSSGMPILIGFINDMEREFFQQFIKVSGIGPRAAIKAFTKPISEISQAINEGDSKFLTSLPGIGTQRAKEVVAKLQGKLGKFGLIQDKGTVAAQSKIKTDWQQEAMDILLQLQYKKNEAQEMIDKALDRCKHIETTEDLLNEIYKQKVKN